MSLRDIQSMKQKLNSLEFWSTEDPSVILKILIERIWVFVQRLDLSEHCHYRDAFNGKSIFNHLCNMWTWALKASICLPPEPLGICQWPRTERPVERSALASRHRIASIVTHPHTAPSTSSLPEPSRRLGRGGVSRSRSSPWRSNERGLNPFPTNRLSRSCSAPPISRHAIGPASTTTASDAGIAPWWIASSGEKFRGSSDPKRGGRYRAPWAWPGDGIGKSASRGKGCWAIRSGKMPSWRSRMRDVNHVSGSQSRGGRWGNVIDNDCSIPDNAKNRANCQLFCTNIVLCFPSCW